MIVSRSSSAMLCSLVCLVGALCITARGQTILIDNFNDGTSDGWACGGFPVPAQCDPFCVASTGAFHLGTEDPVPFGELEVVGAAWSASIDSQNFPLYSNGFFRVRVRADNALTDVGVDMRLRGCQLYWFSALATTGQLRIVAIDCGETGPLLAESVDIGFRAGQDWILEAGAVGDALSFRAWRFDPNDPNAPGPGEPQLFVHNDWFPEGGLTVGVLHEPGYPSAALSGWFDDVSYTPACPGDLNFDHAVDLSDLAPLLAHFGSSCNPAPCVYGNGDLDADGDVDLNDLTYLLANFGTSCP